MIESIFPERKAMLDGQKNMDERVKFDSLLVHMIHSDSEKTNSSAIDLKGLYLRDLIYSTDPIMTFWAFQRDFSRPVNILLWKIEQDIERAFVVLKVTAAVSVEDAGIHHFGISNPLSFLYLLKTYSYVSAGTWILKN